MIKTKSKKIQNHFIVNRLVYSIVIAVILLGTLIGAFWGIKGSSSSTPESYLDSVFSVWKLRGITYSEIFIRAAISNLRNILIIWISGFFIWLIPFNFITVFAKGFGIGYTVSFIVSSAGLKGFLFVFINLLFSNLIILPLMTIFSVTEFKYALKLNNIKNSPSHFRQRRRLILNNILLFLIIVSIAVLASVVEGYLVPVIIKFIV